MSNIPFDINSLTPEQRESARRRVVHELWRRGALEYKYHETQLAIQRAIAKSGASGEREFFLLCSRRTGKTFMLLGRLFARLVTEPNVRLLYLAPFANDAANIATDQAITLLSDCPPELMPEWNNQAKEFRCPKTGGILRIKGVNNERADMLRGGAQHEIVLDECGSMDNLDYILQSVCFPMTLTTRGRVILATTPAVTPGHASTKIYERLAKANAAVKFTIQHSPHLTPDDKVRALRTAGEDPERIPDILAGTAEPETTTAKREYFCEFVTDADSAVVPEFNFKAKQEIVKEWPRPEYYDAYTGADPGIRDGTGLLFAYWDFLNQKLVIEDEALLQHAQAGTDNIARVVKEKEQAQWGWIEPHLRVSDIDLRLITDLRQRHGLKFIPARKDDSQAQIAHLRDIVRSRELVINPRCVNLIRQLENAVFNSKGNDFLRGPVGDIDRHWDLVAALKYLNRHVDRKRNPYPDNYYHVGGKFGPPKGAWISPKHTARQEAAKPHFMPQTRLGKALEARNWAVKPIAPKKRRR